MCTNKVSYFITRHKLGLHNLMFKTKHAQAIINKIWQFLQNLGYVDVFRLFFNEAKFSTLHFKLSLHIDTYIVVS